MSGAPAYKIEYTMQYSTTMYYDEKGRFVAESRENDDHVYDDSGPRDLTDEDYEILGIDC